MKKNKAMEGLAGEEEKGLQMEVFEQKCKEVTEQTMERSGQKGGFLAEGAARV